MEPCLMSDAPVLPYWQIFLGHSFRSCACKFFQIGFFVISSVPVFITLPSPGIIMMCPSHHHHHLQCVSYIFVYFEQFSSKISANFSLWLDMEIIDHCSTSQNVRPLPQCTWLTLAFISSPKPPKLVELHSQVWPLRLIKLRSWRHLRSGNHEITFSTVNTVTVSPTLSLDKVPIISQVSLVSEKEFDENGRYGMHSTTGFLASHGFVKKVILDFSSTTAIFAEARFR